MRKIIGFLERDRGHVTYSKNGIVEVFEGWKPYEKHNVRDREGQLASRITYRCNSLDPMRKISTSEWVPFARKYPISRCPSMFAMDGPFVTWRGKVSLNTKGIES